MLYINKLVILNVRRTPLVSVQLVIILSFGMPDTKEVMTRNSVLILMSVVIKPKTVQMALLVTTYLDVLNVEKQQF